VNNHFIFEKKPAMCFQNKTVFITGASRGIGKAIALKLAADGANIIIAAKSITENDKLGGTIYTAAAEVEAAGGKACPVMCDIRDEASIQAAVNAGVQQFGGIDILINNASAISLTNTLQTTAKRFDLMHQINVRGTFLVTQACLPHLAKGTNPHILTLSPPLNMQVKWMEHHVAYTISKYNMSMMSWAWSEEFKAAGIASNTLWPVTTIATAAVKNLLGGEFLVNQSRHPAIVADAAYELLQKDSKTFTGNFCTDEEILKAAGISNFDVYAVVPGSILFPDFFLT